MGLHRFAVGTALATYLMIVAGGLVGGTDSSSACPDWPLCQGQVAPPLEGSVAIAHGHRIAAALVGALTLALAILVTRARAQLPTLPRLGWLAFALVVAQALLGGLGVLLRLPAAVSAVHTGLSLVFFLTVFYLAAQTAERAVERPQIAPGARRLALVAAIGVLFQAILGGLVRHSGAALACGPDVALCRGALWPEGHVTLHVHLMHRFGAALVAALVFLAGLRTFRAAAGRAWLRALAVTAPVLVVAQILLGVRSVQTFLDLVMVQAHLAVGAALLAVTWALYLLSAPAPAVKRASMRDVIALTKPRITGLVVFTFLAGLALAPGEVTGWRAAVALLGTVLIVAAANALNMYLERDVDGLMRRTRTRPLPQGRLAPEVAVAIGAALAAAAVPLMIVGGNLLTGVLGAAAFVIYVWVYTPMKRRSPAALYVGAVPGAIPPLMGWTAATGELGAPGLVLFAVLFLWQVPHFVAIALYRSDEYAAAGFQTLPVARGAQRSLVHAAVCAAALVVASVLLTPAGAAGGIYLALALLLGGGFFVCSLRGFRAAAPRRWARSLFLASLVYLPALFAALALDRWIG